MSKDFILPDGRTANTHPGREGSPNAVTEGEMARYMSSGAKGKASSSREDEDDDDEDDEMDGDSLAEAALAAQTGVTGIKKKKNRGKGRTAVSVQPGELQRFLETKAKLVRFEFDGVRVELRGVLEVSDDRLVSAVTMMTFLHPEILGGIWPKFQSEGRITRIDGTAEEQAPVPVIYLGMRFRLTLETSSLPMIATSFIVHANDDEA